MIEQIMSNAVGSVLNLVMNLMQFDAKLMIQNKYMPKKRSDLLQRTKVTEALTFLNASWENMQS